jgi:di/tricarboxylate transporter
MDAAIVLVLFAVALGLFVWEKLPVDLVTLILLAALTLIGVLSPTEAFSGFASEIIVILGSISVICGALQRTGVLESLASVLLRVASRGPRRLAAVIMGSAASISGFMNNTTVTAMLLPAVDTVARRSGTSASRLMMPLAFGSILGGTCTLIGTSTNVAVSGYIERAGLGPIGLFEITPIGLVIAAVGIAYMLLVGIRLLPDRAGEMVTPPEAMRDYLCEIEVLPGSPLAGERTFDWELLLLGFRVIQVVRGDRVLAPGAQVRISEGDILLVEGKVDDLVKVQVIEGIRVRTQLDVGELADRPNMTIAEVLVMPGSPVVGQTLAGVDFRQRFGLMVLAINRFGRQLVERLGDYPLSAGDVLLVKGSKKDVERLRHRDSALLPLGEHEASVRGGWRGWCVIACFVAAIVANAAAGIPLAAGFLTTAVVAVLAGSLSADQAREAVDWRLLILIGGMTGFGMAMEKSGAARLLADGVVSTIGSFGPFPVMAGFFVLTIVLTQPMSNAAAALVVLPVALSAAIQVGAEPRTFAIAIMLAASISFITPFEPSCLLVYGPGQYRLRDFVVVGGGLTLVLALVVLPLIPLIWPLG